VARIVAEIPQRIVRDDAASPPDDCPDTLRHVLTVSHRGRAYDFAGAAAMLLRACGYATRVVGGLHVSGERRDVRSRKLVATADDAHVWAEIRDAAGRWIPLEPTPGYRLRPPMVPWTTRALDGLQAAAAWMRARAAAIATIVPAVALLAAGLLGGWRWCVDALITAWWRRALRRDDVCPAHAAWQLIAWRAWLAGCPRRPAETVRDWHRRTLAAARADEPTSFLAAFEQSAYGRPPTPRDRLRHGQAAMAAAQRVTVARLRQRFTKEAHRWQLP
jgi:hypothetical protein